MEKKGQFHTPTTIASGKIPRFPVNGGGGECCCLDPGSALEAVEKTFIAPVQNRTMNPRTSFPQPRYYTDQ